MVGDLASPANRARMMSTYQGFFLVGVGIGPLPGGVLADAFGLRVPFFAYAVFSALAGLVAMYPDRRNQAHRGRISRHA